jgi:NAD-dependent deacetylase
MQVAHIDAFRADPGRFWSFYGERFASLRDKRPNGAHAALVELERRGLLDGVITQNVDMLHRRAGTRELVEVHGSIASCSCPDCVASPGPGPAGVGRVTLEQAVALIADDPEGIPRCAECSAPLKPDVVLFGELLPAAVLGRARRLCERADVLLCIGSSLEVHPVAGLPWITREAGGKVAIVTAGPTPLDDLADLRLDGDVVDELERLVAGLDRRRENVRAHPLLRRGSGR